jgi:hypothetical protein
VKRLQPSVALASSLSDFGVFATKTVVLDHHNTLAENLNGSYVICERRVF